MTSNPRSMPFDIEAAQASLDNIGEGDWTPQDSWLAAALAELTRLRRIEEAARDVAATHHGQWRTRIQSGGNEHVPKSKLERLRETLNVATERES